MAAHILLMVKFRIRLQNCNMEWKKRITKREVNVN